MIKAKTLVVLALILTSSTLWAKKRFTGIASFYGHAHHGKRMSNGKKFNEHHLTAASRILPLGSLVRVTYLKTKKSVVVKITDRGPTAHRRIIDLSWAAAQAIGLTRAGVGRVVVETLG